MKQFRANQDRLGKTKPDLDKVNAGLQTCKPA